MNGHFDNIQVIKYHTSFVIIANIKIDVKGNRKYDEFS